MFVCVCESGREREIERKGKGAQNESGLCFYR